jgi:hypothetical protein
MLSQAAQAFNEQITTSPELQARLHGLKSPSDLMQIAQDCGIELAEGDLRAIAQKAYQNWLSRLNETSQRCFEQFYLNPGLNNDLKQCQTSAEVIALANQSGFTLTQLDLEQAALAASTIDGFSFERLWFKKLGLLT